MAVSRRTLLIAGGAGLGVAVISVLGGTWLEAALDDEPEVDGEVLLDEPGIYQQPLDDVNDDVSGERVPDVPLEAVDGGQVRLTEDTTQPMVVNLWFSNCPPCQRELEDFADVHDEIGDRVRFVGVDPFDTVDTMLRFAEARGVEYELLRDPERTFTNEIGVVAFPVTLFVDTDGRIVRQTGELDADELRDAIDELF
jgi:peroxiredoxin